MSRSASLLLGLGLGLGATAPVMAATLPPPTFIASVNASTCAGVSVDTEPVGFNCGPAAFSSSGPGHLRAFASAFMVRTSSGGDSSGQVSAAAQFTDFVWADGITTGTILIPIEFSGEIAFEGNRGGPDGRISHFGSASSAIGGEVVFSAARQFTNGPEGASDSLVGMISDLTEIAFQVVDGVATMSASLGVTANCSVNPTQDISGSCATTAQYGNSLRFLGARVFDADGVERPDVILTSASGFDYLRGMDPHSPPSPPPTPAVIPLPASAVLLGTSLFAFLAFRRRRERTSIG